MQPADDSRALIWKIYTELGETERHFNDLQARYRMLASTWLLAAFGGIGFVLTAELSFVAVPPALAIAAIGAAAAVGVFLLWMLDLLVYHRMLDAAFIEAWRLEEQHAWLPQVRVNMMLQDRRGMLTYVRFFYVVGSCLMGNIGAFSLGVWAAAQDSTIGFAGAIAGVIGVVVLGLRILRETRDTSDLRRGRGAR